MGHTDAIKLKILTLYYKKGYTQRQLSNKTNLTKGQVYTIIREGQITGMAEDVITGAIKV